MYKVFINNKPKIITDDWENFCSRYIVIKAAGGLVYNDKDQLLMIYRNGKWDLPKGKLEKDEEIKKCAIREVEEECGISNIQIVEELQTTYHTYKLDNKNILKQTFWFKMKSDYQRNLLPQTEEGITQVCWVSRQDIPGKAKNSYGNIRGLLCI